MEYDLVLDNSVLSRFKDGTVSLRTDDKSYTIQYYVPSTQHLEFLDDFENLREGLQESIREVIETIEPKVISLDSAPYGVVPYGHGPYGGGDSKHYQEIVELMPKNDINTKWDALGAEVAINRDLVFVTQDEELRNALEEYSPQHLMTFEEYRTIISED